MICVLVSTESEDEAAKVHLSICWASVRTRGLPLGSGALEGSGSGPGAPAPAQPGPLASDTGTGEEEQDCLGFKLPLCPEDCSLRLRPASILKRHWTPFLGHLKGTQSSAYPK